MKSFNFKFRPLLRVLTAVAFLLSLAGFIWNVYNLVQAIKFLPRSIFSYALISVITLVLTVFVFSVLIYCKYRIIGENLYCNFGFYKTKISVSEVTSITHFKKSDKLVLYLKDQKFTVIVIEPQKYVEFASELIKINDKIGYDTEENFEE